jgi:succinate-semialdehyde dehydrogenase / glutarate-semialdehyde dehydrogenase
MSLVSINPDTGRRIAVYPSASRAEIAAAVARASEAQAQWRRITPAARGRWMRALGRELRVRRDALATLATEEMGKPISQARAEVEKCAMLCDYYAAQATRLLRDQRPAGAPAGSRVTFEPLGTVLAIMPWNFPFWQVLRTVVPAVLSGNAVLLKHAPNVPGCALALAKVFARAKFPAGIFQSLPTTTDRVPALIADPRVHAVTLTGSAAAGRSVAALAGAALKPSVLELGGSDPVLVLEDADIDRAAEIAAHARLLNSGQSCVCAKRFIVVRKVLHKFEARFTARMAARTVGDPMDKTTDIGPLARADLRTKLHAQVRASVRRGARVLLGGTLPRGRGFYYPATVLTDVRPGMPVFDEETFGPVAAIIPARDEADAVTLANTSVYGLGAAIFTRSRARARKLVPQLQAGCVFVNDFVRSSPELPFGGVKQSGYGRELGIWGVQAFVNVKTVCGG